MKNSRKRLPTRREYSRDYSRADVLRAMRDLYPTRRGIYATEPDDGNPRHDDQEEQGAGRQV